MDFCKLRQESRGLGRVGVMRYTAGKMIKLWQQGLEAAKKHEKVMVRLWLWGHVFGFRLVMTLVICSASSHKLFKSN